MEEKVKLQYSIVVHLEKMRADFIVLATNTMYKVEYRSKKLNIELFHIADKDDSTLKAKNIKKIVLLGNKIYSEKNISKR